MIPLSFEDCAVRMMDQGGEFWFVGRDVCDALGHTNSRRALSRLPDDERKGVAIGDHLGKNSQITTIINEPGIYRLIMTSRVPAAERFKRWLFHDVLPAIRKTGRYEAPRQETSAEPDPWSAMETRLAAVERAIKFGVHGTTGALGTALTYLPIWPSSKRPRFWRDLEVRQFLLTCHRQMTIDDALAATTKRFGDRCPSRSAIGRFWQRLDVARGLKRDA